MSEKQYDVQAVKERLIAYREMEREIENQSELLERLVTRLEGIGAQEITDMPKAPSPSNDRMSDLISKKIELENLIGEDLAFQRSERHYFEKILKSFKLADERAIIRMRYFMRMSWEEVNYSIFGGSKDYVDKEESYRRRTMKLHENALLHIAMYIEDHPEKNKAGA